MGGEEPAACGRGGGREPEEGAGTPADTSAVCLGSGSITAVAMATRTARQKNLLPPCYYEGFLEKRSFKDKVGGPVTEDGGVSRFWLPVIESTEERIALLKKIISKIHELDH